MPADRWDDLRRLGEADALCRGAGDPTAVALWTGYRLGVLDAQGGPETFAGLLDDQAPGLLDQAQAGYIAGRGGLTPADVLDQLERERHAAVARMTGIGARREVAT